MRQFIAPLVLQLLKEAPGMKYTIQEIADNIGQKNGSVTRATRVLHTRGEINSDRTGRCMGRGHLVRFWVPALRRSSDA